MEALGQLTGGVAHDFNNLLTAIGGSISLAQKRLDRPESASDFLQEASQSVRRAAALTQRLLAFSRKQNLLPRVLDVNALVSGMEALLRRSLGETVLIDVRLSDRLWPCEVDPAQLENLLLNLAVNARDAMPRGGRLSIRTDNVDVAASAGELPAGIEPGEFILLSVSDDGEGMDGETLRQAFEPFFTTKEVGRGSGLGLSMVYGFVHQSGGQVAIDSQPGLGTTVRVYLPRTTALLETGPGGPAQPQEPKGNGEVVLVVEDEPAVRRMATQLIEELGYRTVVAADAATALDRLERTPDVALLFTDIVLPGGVSGVELADDAKERCPGLGVVFASGYTRSEMTDQDRLDPELRFLQKPYSASALAHALAQALPQSAAKRPSG
jgi:CheY-like chemotaxis protein